jgi:hypothetical protein
METVGAEIFTAPTIFGAGAGSFGAVVEDELEELGEDELEDEDFVGVGKDFTVTGTYTKAASSQLSHSWTTVLYVPAGNVIVVSSLFPFTT